MTEITFTQFQAKYKYQNHLSQGGFGRVCQIIEKGTQNRYALKKLEIKSSQQLSQAMKEINLMLKLSNYSVVKIIEYYIVQTRKIYSSNLYEVGIVMELAKGSLSQLIKQNPLAISQSESIRILSTMVAILLKCQNQNIAHRDVKPGNILYFKKQNKFQWKLADFGLAIEATNKKTRNCFVGSYEYASPNLKRKFKYPKLNLKFNSFKDDVYSLGITMLQVLTGKTKHNCDNQQQLSTKFENKKLLKIILSMLQQDEQKRPCFKQLQSLIWNNFQQSLIIQNDEQKQNKQINCIVNSQIQTKSQIQKQEQTQKQNSQYKIVQQYKNELDKKQEVKTQVINYSQLEMKMINIGKPVYSLAILEQKVVCGCPNGDIVIIYEDLLITIKQLYTNVVTQLVTDSNENLWATGIDGKIYVISKKSLLASINKIKGQSSNKQNKSISIQKTKIDNIIEVKVNKQIKTKTGVSCLLVKDESHFCVGYFDGWVYIKWGDMEFKQHLYRAPITAFSFDNQYIMSCSLDKLVKMIQIEQLKLSNRMFIAPKSLTNMKIIQDQKQRRVQVLALDGQIYILNQLLQQQKTKYLQKNQYLCSFYKSDKFYTVSSNGHIFMEQQQVNKIDIQGASCIQIGDEGEIVIGSFDGNVSMLLL